jgi:DNA-directed RNA polymerase subunit RPC12/RpoP
MDDFRCTACGSPALVYPRVLKGDEPVACASCGEFVSTYGELKQRSERAPGPCRVPVSGC